MTLNGQGKNAQASEAPGPNVSPTDSVDLQVEVFVGETQLTIGELNRLKDGAVLRLSATLADPVELRVNGARIARGELVAVGDQFAVRIIEIA
jgi:flagellar motor switch protein FliN/FliY